MNYTETNKLIAEFMKWKKVNAGLVGYETPHSVALIQPSEMLFRKSWDWLMPVIEKIEKLGYTFEKNYQRVDKDWQSLIVKGNDILYQEFNNDSLKSSYYVVVEFIKFYNNQNK
tara:strand:+ start:145 stop:486 length:342 start_codon:yes stop_codon:yes gene_type:complete